MKSLSALILGFSLIFATVFAQAAVDYTIRTNPGIKNSVSVEWQNTASGAAGVAYKTANFDTNIVQANGTFASGILLIQGSNDGTNYVTLTTGSGVAASMTAAGIMKINESTLYIKPVVSGGTSSAIDVFLHSK